MNLFKKIDVSKLYGVLVGSIFFIMSMLLFTYAYYSWQGEKKYINLGILDTYNGCVISTNIDTSEIFPVQDYKDGIKVNFKLNSDNEVLIDFSLKITQLDDVLKQDYFKYMLVYDVGGGRNYDYDNPLATGNFTEMVVGANKILDELPIVENQTVSYQFIIYLDGTVYNDPAIQDASLTFALLLGNCDNDEIEVEANVPNLDNGNLIPVYFDENAGTTGEWKKADSNNINNSWYDYSNKEWANAVITSNDTYKTALVGTTIIDSDIIAFYVWIPRYKYRVWNITRQGGAESTYAYPAFSEGIDIKFESGTNSTGNVECTYVVTTGESDINLSDVCVYNENDTINTTSGNTNYTDVWYTHPAFTFGDKKITGFWIGKFETSGDATTPKVLPDVSSLRSQTVSVQFTTSKVFQKYLTSNIDAHMLTNLEWGAVVYLSHSTYGLCNGTSCDGVYHNNSSGYYTGRSGGAIAGSTNLNLANVYPESSSSTSKYNSTGYYDYKGNFIDYDGTITSTKDISKVASTTRNITGVYDLSGGAYEYVMGNMVDSTYNFYPAGSGIGWNGSAILASKYYNSYSYGTNYYKPISYNRARLGDAMSEVLGSSTLSSGAWKPGSGITGSYSYFLYSTYTWIYRGGYYYSSYSGSFNFDSHNGNSYNDYSFRSALS